MVITTVYCARDHTDFVTAVITSCASWLSTYFFIVNVGIVSHPVNVAQLTFSPTLGTFIVTQFCAEVALSTQASQVIVVLPPSKEKLFELNNDPDKVITFMIPLL